VLQEEWGRGPATTVDGRLFFFPWRDGFYVASYRQEKCTFPESLKYCMRRYKQALIDVAIQRNAIVEIVDGRFRRVSPVEIERFVER
jgi:hypothetical protein